MNTSVRTPQVLIATVSLALFSFTIPVQAVEKVILSTNKPITMTVNKQQIINVRMVQAHQVKSISILFRKNCKNDQDEIEL